MTGMSTLPSYPFTVRTDAGDDALHAFYLPLYERAVACDRILGPFSATALADAAAGIVRLIAAGGRLRIVCGAALDAEPGEEALAALDDPGDATRRERLAALAWMLAHQHLEIRLALPERPGAEPLCRDEPLCGDEGVARDAEGHRLAWSGGLTFASWDRKLRGATVDASPAHVRAVEERFASLWDGEAPGWRVLELPPPVRSRLLELCPDEAPRHDPHERRARLADLGEEAETAGDVDERLLFRFLREAPYLPGATDLGVATSPVTAWPHQLRVVRRVVDCYPRSFLFADEVGLGKTVEAALALRQLTISGRVRRALVLVPRSILRQWQEELYEKAALNVPRYTGEVLLDVHDREVAIGPRRPRGRVWNAAPFILASSQLVKRRDRRRELLAAEPWDLVVVDEAHHARRKDFRGDRYRPNRLLELLAGSGARPGLKDRTRCLYLVTATPMQVHPVELWDLLRLLGLGGRWGALPDPYLAYFEQLRGGFEERDWPLLLGLLGDHLTSGGELDAAFRRQAAERLGKKRWTAVRALPGRAAEPGLAAEVLALDGDERAVLDEMVRRHTPIGRFVHRHTRRLLHKYRMQGLIDADVPARRPENVWIRLRDDERTLYERIEEYLGEFYRRYEAERRGLGFVMTVYRRRLTSSFYAVRRSLERRLETLRGTAPSGGIGGDDTAPSGGIAGDDTADADLFAPEDLDEGELDLDLAAVADDDGDDVRDELRRSEEAYLEDFLAELDALGPDSKLERLLTDLEAILAERGSVLVFTQYTDTMDYLRDELRRVYGGQVGCYSGRGGELWDGEAWRTCRKEEIKEAFRDGANVRVLLATEAASEGLNLQTCGALVNFDMPWNPMRVEQRIGRIDRIGQRYREVWIKSYFYDDTVEAIVYQRLGERIRWFEEVVGELQPILHQVGETIEKVAMLQGKRRLRRLEERLTALGMEMDERRGDALSLEPEGEPPGSQELKTPVAPAELEATLVGSQTLGTLFASAEEVDGAYVLSWGEEERRVTFRPEVFDRHPSTVEFLTYGHPLFDELLASVADAPEAGSPRGLGLYRLERPVPLAVLYRPTATGAVPVSDLAELRRTLAARRGIWPHPAAGEAESYFANLRRELAASYESSAGQRREAGRRALVESARQVLRRSALVTLARGASPSLFEAALPYGFGEEAVAALAHRGQPFIDLLALARGEDLEVRSDEAYFRKLVGRGDEEMQRKSKALVTEGKEIVRRHEALAAVIEEAEATAREEAAEPAERRFFLLAEEEEDAEDDAADVLVRLADDEVRPFESSVPLYDDLASTLPRLAEELAEGSAQDDELRHPSEYEWVELKGRVVPERGLFVARHLGAAMDRRIEDGAWCLFRLVRRVPRDGQVVLALHPSLDDPHLGRAALRIYETKAEGVGDGEWRRRVVLRPSSTDDAYQPVVLDPEDGGLVVVAEFLEVVG